MKRMLMLLTVLALAGCNLNPPQRHVTSDGRACHPLGPFWAQTWASPDNMRAC